MIQPSHLPISSRGNRASNAFPGTTRHVANPVETTSCSWRSTTPFPLARGGELNELCLAYELSGAPGAPLVVALGGISADRHVVASSEDPSPGWWATLVGPGRAVDPGQVRVLSFDWVGGNGASTGPRNPIANNTDDRDRRVARKGRPADPRQVPGTFPAIDSRDPRQEPGTFPAIDSRDQANALALLLEHLGEPRVDCFLGASYGGMVALAFAAAHPQRVGHVIAISAPDRPHPRSTAWRAVQRRIVDLGGRSGASAEGMALARGLAMTTYRSADELAERFAGGPELVGDGVFRFPVEGYLDSRGEAFSTSFHPAAFRCLSQSIDLHRVDPARIVTPITLVGATSDELVPIDQLRRLAITLGPRADLVTLESRYGHDAFLKEGEAIAPVVRRILESVASPLRSATQRGGLV